MEPTKAQRNDIFEAIVKSGLNPAYCKLSWGSPVHVKMRLTETPTTEVAVRHLPSESYFDYVAVPNGMHKVSSRIGDEPTKSSEEAGWSNLWQSLAAWANKVRIWTGTPDLWGEFRQAAESLNSAGYADSSNAPFTPEEQTQISVRIGEIKDYIRATYELTSEQMARVEERLDAAEQASKRIGRKDWLMAFNGAVFSLFLSDLIPQQAATHMVVMAISGLGHLFGIGSLPPNLPPA